MKSINKFTVLFLCMILTFNSCTEEADYTAAGIPDNLQVYFTNTQSDQVDLTKEGNSFDVELRRARTNDAFTVNLQVVNENPDIFTIPTSATFADGSNQTAITIIYDPEKLEYDDYKSISLSISEESVITEYGANKYEFNAGIPAPWESLGMATYTDDFISAFFGISQVPYEVEIQENIITPGLFRLINPYSPDFFPYGLNKDGSYDSSTEHNLEIDARDPEAVVVRRLDTGLNWGYGNFIISSLAYERILTGSSLEDVKAQGICGTYSNGVITFPTESLLSSMANYQDARFYVANSNGWFSIIMPGVIPADYSAQITYLGRFTDIEEVDYAAGWVTLGEDVASAKVALIPGNITEEAVNGVIDGSIESIEILESSRVEIPCGSSGRYTFVVITYNSDGDPQQSSSESFKFTSSLENAETWKSLGMTNYTDDLFGQFYSEEPYTVTYEVELQESEQNPGKFRLVNPYGEVYPGNVEGDYDDSRDYYMVINAMDPDGVYIELQNMGIDWGNGGFYAYSFAAYHMDQGKTLEEVKAMENICGKYENGIITFPRRALLGMFEGDTGLYYANNNGAFRVIIPGEAQILSLGFPLNLAQKSIIKTKHIVEKNTIIKRKSEFLY